jgi:type VI secretion system protein ImpA
LEVTPVSDSQSPPVFDVEALVQPIPGDAPCGVDLRGDDSPASPYYAIKDARNSARAVERQLLLDPTAETAPPDWSPVMEMAPALLAEKTKDLEIVAWFIEALVRTHGFAGMRDGYVLARRLCETFWDGVFPMPDEEGVATRVAPLTGLNGADSEGTLIAPIRTQPLATGPEGQSLGMWEYDKAVELDKLPAEEKQAKIAEGAVSLADFEAAVRRGGAARYRTLAADLAGSREAFDALGAVLDEKCGADSPPMSNIRSMLEKFDEVLRLVAREFLVVAEAPAAGAADAGGADSGSSAGGGGGVGGALNSREDAFRQLELVADYFRRTEPHSPLSYSLQQAVRWGRMPLPDLLTELIPDENVRNQLFRVTGMAPPPA